MSQTTITVADAKAKRRELECSIQGLLQKFQQETGLAPRDVRVEYAVYGDLIEPGRYLVTSVCVNSNL